MSGEPRKRPARLTADHCDLILESLKFTRQRFEEYQHYPSYDFKVARLRDVDSARDAITETKRRIKK